MPLCALPDRNIELFYETQGSGPPLFFISGYLASHYGMIPLSSHFQEKYQTVLLDNRGSGASTHPDTPFCVADMAKDVIALMDHLQLEKAHFVGASMGAGIVMTLCALFPERIEKAALITPFHKMPKPSLIAAELAKESLENTLPFEKTCLPFMAWLYSDTFLSSPENVEAKIKQILSIPPPTSPTGARQQYEALASYDISDHLTSIRAPLLILAGKQDLLAPAYVTEHLMKHLPTATLFAFDLGAHMIHHENTTCVAEHIKKFL